MLRGCTVRIVLVAPILSPHPTAECIRSWHVLVLPCLQQKGSREQPVCLPRGMGHLACHWTMTGSYGASRLILWLLAG